MKMKFMCEFGFKFKLSAGSPGAGRRTRRLTHSINPLAPPCRRGARHQRQPAHQGLDRAIVFGDAPRAGKGVLGD